MLTFVTGLPPTVTAEYLMGKMGKPVLPKAALLKASANWQLKKKKRNLKLTRVTSAATHVAAA